MCLFLAGPVWANVPGGGSTGANVTFSSTSTTATLSNGIITAVIDKAGGDVTSMLFNGVQTVGPGDNAYFSMDGGATFEGPHACVMSVVANTTDMVDLAFTQTYVSGNSAYIHAEDMEIHYVLRRGAKGLYVYAILNHPAGYPALSMGEWRMVWKLPHDNTNFFFEKEYVDNFRHHDMPNYAVFAASTTTRIAEIGLLNSGPRAGLYNCKYEFSQEYQTFGVWGHASDTNQKGVWFVPGSFEFFNDGPTHQDLIVAESYSLMHFGRNHYGGSSTNVPNGTAWSKMYGPYLLYCNSAATADACWADAQAQAAAEQGAWPYSWLAGNALYPLASGRGSVSGQFVVVDSLKPAVSGANAWVGLTTPDGTGTYDWLQDSLNYQYWVKADANGNFVIPNVRPGTYTLYAFVNGAVGQYSQASVTVTAGQTNALGPVTWNVAHSGNWIAWEIGVPDRNATEFRHGKTDYYIPYIWTDFVNEFSNPLNFTIGSSNWASDWNYNHGFWQVGGTYSAVGTLSNWPWNINFNLDSVPASGNAVLTIAFAGSNGGHLRIWVNRATTSNPNFDFTTFIHGGGNALLREGVHANYELHTYSFAVSNLHTGSNTITLMQINGAPGEGNGVMYDYINLEMPGSAPTAQPAVGRSFTWVGGEGGNSWDVGTFSNWVNSGGVASFNQGDVVTFDDAGVNTPAIALNGVLVPNGIIVNSGHNYTFSGSGSISGATSLAKSGAGTLTISNSVTNTWNGATTITGGTLQLNTALTNSNSVTVQSGATLALGANLTTASLQVDSGATLAGGTGNITAAVLNNGTMTLSGGGTFTITGAVTNNSVVRVNNGTQLVVTGAFTNNGVLDLITGAQSLPTNLVNHGVVLDSSAVKVQGIAVSGNAVTVTIVSYAGHNYQLQWSGTIVSPSWQNIGAAQAGTGGTLTFTDTNGLTGGSGFFRVVASP